MPCCAALLPCCRLRKWARGCAAAAAYPLQYCCPRRRGHRRYCCRRCCPCRPSQTPSANVVARQLTTALPRSSSSGLSRTVQGPTPTNRRDSGSRVPASSQPQPGPAPPPQAANQAAPWCRSCCALHRLDAAAGLLYRVRVSHGLLKSKYLRRCGWGQRSNVSVPMRHGDNSSG